MIRPPGRVVPAPWTPPGAAWRESARWEWRVADGGDPWSLLQDRLTSQGFSVLDMSVHRDVDTHDPHGPHAVLLLGARAGAVALGAAPGPGSPVSGVPDVALIVLEATSDEGHPEGQRRAGHVAEWTEAWTAADHVGAVKEVRERIARGDVYQVNLVTAWTGEVVGSAVGLLDRVLDLPGAVWRGAVSGEGWAVASASPENLLRVVDGQISSRPVKGTLAVGADPVASRAALLASAKDRAEHVMIVDLVRNDLAQVTEPGSVAVPELFEVEEWSGLWHAHSTVTGQVRPGTGLADVLRAVLPGGSVTGAPKRAALEVIEALEPVGRGPAMGALGWIDRSGRLELGLTIRTAALDLTDPHRPVAALWAGGGITWGSDPEGERAEALAKARPLLEVLSRG